MYDIYLIFVSLHKLYLFHNIWPMLATLASHMFFVLFSLNKYWSCLVSSPLFGIYPTAFTNVILIDPSFEHNNNRFVPQERLKIEVSMGTTSSSIFVVKRKPRVFSHFFLWFTGMKSIRIIGSFIGSNEFLCILLLTKVWRSIDCS